MQAKIGSGETSFAGGFAGYDEYVPMVDKAVDATWKVKPAVNRVPSKGNLFTLSERKVSLLASNTDFGLLSLFTGARMPPNVPKDHESFSTRVLVIFMAFVMAVFTYFRTVSYHVVSKQLPPPTRQPQIEGNTATEEADLLNSVLKKLTELEEKIGDLQSKPSEMPYEKEELLNAAVCRVDALEAELIATKKVSELLCSTTENPTQN